jgi:hypothetical protein
MELKPSTRKGKRYMAVFPDGTITHFGSATMENYTIHGDEARKKAYLRRHKKNEDWTDPKSAGALAKYILWNKPTIEASLADYRETFGLGLSAKKVEYMTSSAYKDTKQVGNIGKFVLDPKLSTDETKVWVNHSKKEVAVSNRGTKGMLDWLNNAAFAMGKYDITPRFQRAKSIQNAVLKKYKGYKITNLGHSQGGIITKKLNDAGMTDAVINVNPAVMPMERKPKKNETTIKSSTDVVSVFHRKGANDIVLKDKTGNLLEEHKTNIVGRLDPKQVIGTGAGIGQLFPFIE